MNKYDPRIKALYQDVINNTRCLEVHSTHYCGAGLGDSCVGSNKKTLTIPHIRRIRQYLKQLCLEDTIETIDCPTCRASIKQLCWNIPDKSTKWWTCFERDERYRKLNNELLQLASEIMHVYF